MPWYISRLVVGVAVVVDLAQVHERGGVGLCAIHVSQAVAAAPLARLATRGRS